MIPEDQFRREARLMAIAIFATVGGILLHLGCFYLQKL